MQKHDHNNSGFLKQLVKVPFFRRKFDLLLQEQEEHKHNVVHRRRSRVQQVLALSAAIISALFIGSQIVNLRSVNSDIYRSGQFHNLTQENLEWDVFYGQSPTCEEEGLPCHLTDRQDVEFDQKMVLPAREFPLKGYEKGEIIFIRTHLTVPPEVLQQNTPIVFHALYVWAETWQFYVDGHLLDEGGTEGLNITIPREYIDADGRVFVAMKINPGNLPYQGLANRMDILIGPKNDLINATVHRPYKSKYTYFLWYLLPRLTLCIIFSIMYIFLAQNRELFSFILYLFFTSATIFSASGYSSGLNEVLGINLDLMNKFFAAYANVVLILFIHDFFRRTGARFYRVIKWTLIASPLLFGVLLAVGDSRLLSNTLGLLGPILKSSAMIYGIYCSFITANFLKLTGQSPIRKTVSSFLCVVFFILLIPESAELTRTINEIRGVQSSGFTWPWLTDLVFFVILASITGLEFGMTATAKQQIEKDFKILEERLELGRSVQEMLFPPAKDGVIANSSFQFFFEPAQMMAGDWYYVWPMRNGGTCLFVGDVMGKGPQAALAVSAIICIINESQHLGETIEEAILRINKRLFSLFKGKVLSTMNVTIVYDDGSCDLYNCGTVGWVAEQDGKYKLVPLVGRQLGQDDSYTTKKKSLEASEFNRLFTFTDGVIEGSRALRKLLKTYATLPEPNPVEIFNTTVEVGREHVHEDDKTMLVITKKANAQEAA